jgi:signal transduction histidine kinase
MKKYSTQMRWTLAGVGFGFLFPLIATLIKSASVQPEHFIDFLLSDSLFLMICTAPFFLGLLAFLGGLQQAKVKNLNENLEKLVQERTEALITSAKFASLGEMASGILHEITNPMTVIKIRANDLHEKSINGTLDITTVEKNSKALLKATETALKIIHGIRSFANANAQLKLENCSLQSLLDDVVLLTEFKTKKTYVELILPESVPDFLLKIHPVQITQVIVNLINNACDAIENQESKWIKLVPEIDGGIFRLKIIDSGHGIPLDIQKKLGVDNFTTKPPGKGTGLGLSISKMILEKHTGKLWVDNSNPNTCFVLELPFR